MGPGEVLCHSVTAATKVVPLASLSPTHLGPPLTLIRNRRERGLSRGVIRFIAVVCDASLSRRSYCRHVVEGASAAIDRTRPDSLRLTRRWSSSLAGNLTTEEFEEGLERVFGRRQRYGRLCECAGHSERQRIDPRGQTSIEQGHDNRDKPLTTRDRLEIESF